MDYLLLKWIHILSSTILFGTGIGSAFYMFMANRRKDIAGIYFATRHVVIADWIFTTPAVIIQFLTGVALAHTIGLPLFEGWVRPKNLWKRWFQLTVDPVLGVAAVSGLATISVERHGDTIRWVAKRGSDDLREHCLRTLLRAGRGGA